MMPDGPLPFLSAQPRPRGSARPSGGAAGDTADHAAGVRVKICGLTTVEDAESAIAAGADALGFNTWQGSRRHLNLKAAADWIARLPASVARVVLCVNAPLEDALAFAKLPFADILQLHGDESKEYCNAVSAVGGTWIRAVRLEREDQIPALAAWGTRNVLIDAAVAGAFGGTGARLDMELASHAVNRLPELNVILAGGLDPDNVAEAVRVVRPYAVDVASGVESAPGRKDFAKMRDFIQAARGAF